MKLVITVVGRDQVGIIAMISSVLAECNINICNLDQTIVDGFFNMIMIANAEHSTIGLQQLQEILQGKGKQRGLDIRVQHADIFQSMHKV
ncbi:MAG: ACT domain-containing protein [Negativicutes bacterium]|nr:ACT domain-containing protein [Negativicutes bacterium]